MCKKIKGGGEGQKESTKLFFITSSLPSQHSPRFFKKPDCRERAQVS